jgi:hypothetical protein
MSAIEQLRRDILREYAQSVVLADRVSYNSSAPESVVRMVTENSRTLKFTS